MLVDRHKALAKRLDGHQKIVDYKMHMAAIMVGKP